MQKIFFGIWLVSITVTLFCINAFLYYMNKTELNVLDQTKQISNQISSIETKSEEGILPYTELGNFVLTWYSPKELGKQYAHQLKTSTGTTPKESKTIAVDPKLIPYGSIVYIQGYGYFIAEDCGGDIKNKRIDIFTSSHETAIKNGRKTAKVYLLK